MSETTIATAPHEVRGYIAWNDHGDAPFWASTKLVAAAGGGGSYTVEIDGEEIDVSLGFKGDENISPRPEDTVSRIRPTNLFWTEPDGRNLGVRIKPSFKKGEFRQYEPDKPFHQREPIRTPPDLGEATRARIVSGTYTEPMEYARRIPEILEALAVELGVGWDHSYLRGQPVPEASTITTLARTVRLERSTSRKLVRDEGILKRLGLLLNADPAKGSRIIYDEDHRNGLDWRHTVKINRKAAESLLPMKPPGVEIKVYHPEHVRSDKSKDDPLYHPRVEVTYRKSLNGPGISITETDRMADRLEEILVNVLLWGGVPIEPSTPPFIPDDYQDVEASDRPVRLFDDPTPQLERDQEGDLFRAIARASTQDVDRLVDVLAADGGQPTHRKDVEEILEISPSTYYRFVNRLEGLLESDNGWLRFISEHQRQLALDVLEPLRAEVSSKMRAIANLADLDPQLLAKKGSAFQKWVTTYAIEPFSDDDGRLRKIKIDATLARYKSSSVPKLEDVLREGLKAWEASGLGRREYLSASAIYRDVDSGGKRVTSISSALGAGARGAL